MQESFSLCGHSKPQTDPERQLSEHTHLSHTCDFERWLNYAEHRSQRGANQDAHTDSTQLRMYFEAQESYTCPDIALLKHLRPGTTHIRALIATVSII
jgi:hypothetical protein